MLIVDMLDGSYKVITKCNETIIQEDELDSVLKTNLKVKFTSVAEYDEDTDSYLEVWDHNKHSMSV